MTIGSRSIVVTGLGACTSVGAEVLTTAAAVRAGISNAREHAYIVDRHGELIVAASAPFLDPRMRALERLVHLAALAALEAIRPLERSEKSPPIAVVVGLPESRPGLPDLFEVQFRTAFFAALRDRLDLTAVVVAASGHAGGLLAVKHACELVASGTVALCLAGGVDSWIEVETLEWLDSLERLHSPSSRWGFCPGEGAGFCLVCGASEAERLRLPVYAAVLAASSANETNHILSDAVCIGDGLTKACRDAVACVPHEVRVDHTICDMNGEPYRGDEYGFMMTRLGPHFAETASFETPAQSWGDVGAASGPLFVVVASIAAQKAYAPGPLTLVYAGSDSGRRSAALIETPEAPK